MYEYLRFFITNFEIKDNEYAERSIQNSIIMDALFN